MLVDICICEEYIMIFFDKEAKTYYSNVNPRKEE